MTRRRWIIYLLLNVFISVLVSGTILYFYHQSNLNTDCASIVVIPTISSRDINVEIVSVSGMGALDSEAVVVRNNSDEAFQMEGWMIKDSQGSIYTFPQLTLYPAGTVRVYTRSGVDTATDLFWNRSEPVWESGELAALYDPQGIVRAFYRVP
jgi:archaellum component FlaF (FlaF/FlaG flagellin family)